MKKRRKTRKKKTNFKFSIKELLRVSFWAMIIVLFVMMFIPEDFFLFDILAFVWFALVIVVFIASIIHLSKYKKKSFAVTALVFSSLFLLVLLFAFFAIFTTPSYGEEVIIYNENISIPEDLMAIRFFTLYEDGFLTMNFSSDILSDIYLFDENEYQRFANNETSYYIEGQQETNEMNWNLFLTKGKYVIVIFPSRDNESVSCSFYLSVTPYS